jgi:hypothetical protein
MLGGAGRDKGAKLLPAAQPRLPKPRADMVVFTQHHAAAFLVDNARQCTADKESTHGTRRRYHISHVIYMGMWYV